MFGWLWAQRKEDWKAKYGHAMDSLAKALTEKSELLETLRQERDKNRHLLAEMARLKGGKP